MLVSTLRNNGMEKPYLFYIFPYCGWCGWCHGVAGAMLDSFFFGSQSHLRVRQDELTPRKNERITSCIPSGPENDEDQPVLPRARGVRSCWLGNMSQLGSKSSLAAHEFESEDILRAERARGCAKGRRVRKHTA